ncbi:unnamed protein product [Leptosia nina]|uniref:Uncharacterized protein n=1 Tax=Leptosia nina TaxID=320188 RepID=A0AAV1JA44_9NEOP
MFETFIVIIFYSIPVDTQEKLFPEISDLFETFNDPLNIEPVGEVVVRNISVDVEKIDIRKLKNKLSVKTNLTDVLPDIYLNETRRLDRVGSKREFYAASELEVKIKLLDLMLQLIYMARHKLKRLEAEKYFNPKDTSYRIAFLYRRLIRIYKRMTDVYTTMWNKRIITEICRHFHLMGAHLLLHHKAAKLHVDFLYLWWVLVKLHEKFCLAYGLPNYVPDVI